LIEDILEMNRVEVNEILINPEKFSIKKLVNEVVRFVATPIRAKKIRFHYFLDPQIPVSLIGDARRIKQIILNLINNSIKFTDKGSITLEVLLNGSTDLVNRMANLKIVVRDTGIGIPKENQGKIFKSFVQLDPSSTRNRGGVGLGLAIVETYVRKMNGKINLESNQGSGTSISVDLKIPFDSEKPWIETFDLSEALRGKKIFVLTSSDMDFKNISNALGRFGAITTQESSGIKFSETFAKVIEDYDYLVLDSDMSDLGAIEVLSTNLNDMDKRNNIVVLLHQKHRRDDAQILANLGISRVCFKPLIFNEFFKALNFREKFQAKFDDIGDGAEYESVNSLSVLVAEDDPDNRNLIEAFLKPLNLNLAFANDGVEALEKFKTMLPRVVITDIQMPRMDGFGFLKAAHEYLEAMPEQNKCYFMVLTADAMPEQIREAKKLGAKEYLTKPIQKRDFINKIIKAHGALMKDEDFGSDLISN
jgi:CheY-like chemotaxis protein